MIAIFLLYFFFRKAIWLLHELTYGGLAQMGPSSLGERRTGSFSEQRLVIESSRKFKKKILHRGHHVRFCHPTLSGIQENYKLVTAYEEYVFYGQKGSFEAWIYQFPFRKHRNRIKKPKMISAYL